MNSVLIPLLIGITRSPSADAYLQAQDEALHIAAAQYEQLQVEARERDDQGLRREALGLIALLSRADAEELLLDSAQNDPEPEVAEFAKALLYQLSVARNVRAAGHMSDEQFEVYQARRRRLAAEARFAQRK